MKRLIASPHIALAPTGDVASRLGMVGDVASSLGLMLGMEGVVLGVEGATALGGVCLELQANDMAALIREQARAIKPRDANVLMTLGRVYAEERETTGRPWFATPIVRYDVGDFAQLEQGCRCGDDEPTISDIFGRGKPCSATANGKPRRSISQLDCGYDPWATWTV